MSAQWTAKVTISYKFAASSILSACQRDRGLGIWTVPRRSGVLAIAWASIAGLDPFYLARQSQLPSAALQSSTIADMPASGRLIQQSELRARSAVASGKL